MSFNNQQQDEHDRYARYWAQYATYPPVSQPTVPSQQIPTVVPSQASWSNEEFNFGSMPQNNTFFEEPQALYPQTEFLMPPQTTPSLPISQVPSYQSSPAMAFSSPQLSYTSEPAIASASSHMHDHRRTYSHDSHISYASTQAPSPAHSESAFSRSSSPGNADMSQFGYLNAHGTWNCNYPGCTSRAVFTRGCDLRKHHKRHTKSFFCRYPGCSQSTGGGFSSKKDLARHEAKHNPGVVCEWDGCDRIFSRVDNMVCSPFHMKHETSANISQRDHVKRIHLKGAKKANARRASQQSQTSQA